MPEVTSYLSDTVAAAKKLASVVYHEQFKPFRADSSREVIEYLENHFITAMQEAVKIYEAAIEKEKAEPVGAGGRKK